jgi:hypothetical protein
VPRLLRKLLPAAASGLEPEQPSRALVAAQDRYASGCRSRLKPDPALEGLLPTPVPSHPGAAGGDILLHEMRRAVDETREPPTALGHLEQISSQKSPLYGMG